jgi:hypothetical protein
MKSIAIVALGAGATAAFSSINRGIGLAALLGSLGWAVWAARDKGADGGIALEVEADDLLVADGRGVLPRRVALAKVREVEIESKAIRRVAYTQQVGEALPSTRVSGDVDVARIVLVVEGEAQPIRLTEAYESYSNCAECFGKVRVFLRSHGWLPEGEREA